MCWDLMIELSRIVEGYVKLFLSDGSVVNWDGSWICEHIDAIMSIK